LATWIVSANGADNLKKDTMENRENLCQRWPIAVTVSVLLHGVVLLGFSLISGRQAIDARTTATATCLSFCALEVDDGEVRFEGPRAPVGDTSPHHFDRRTGAPDANAEPVTATLREPWAQDAEESGAGAIGPGTTGTGPSEPVGNASTSFFRVTASGQRIIYVLDGSASMGKKDALKAACRELYQSVRSLPGAARFQIIIYNHEPHYLLPSSFRKWLEPTSAMVSAVGAALLGQVAEGATNHDPALKEAFTLHPSPDVVFFLTDADDLKPEHLRLVSSLNRGRAIVNTIELNNRNRGRSEMPLQAMARDNRGVYQAVDLELK
jgi:hypothetical protein